MFDTITSLPWHALVVHATIVFIPLAAVGAVLVALRADLNRRFGFLVVAFALVGAGSSVVAKESGEKLASRVGLPSDHAQWGRWVVISSGLLFLAVAALWWIDRRRPEGRTSLARLLVVGQIVIAAAAFVVVAMAGHTGAQAVWGPIIQHTKPGTFQVH